MPNQLFHLLLLQILIKTESISLDDVKAVIKGETKVVDVTMS